MLQQMFQPVPSFWVVLKSIKWIYVSTFMIHREAIRYLSYSSQKQLLGCCKIPLKVLAKLLQEVLVQSNYVGVNIFTRVGDIPVDTITQQKFDNQYKFWIIISISGMLQCCVVMKADPFHAFLSLASLNLPLI